MYIVGVSIKLLDFLYYLYGRSFSFLFFSLVAHLPVFHCFFFFIVLFILFLLFLRHFLCLRCGKVYGQLILCQHLKKAFAT